MSDDVGRPDALAKMREPFPAHQIGQINRGGGVVLDYVGHAAITDRLLDADPEWTWKPLALDAAGLPAFDRAQNGQPIGLWIVLTVRGVSRLGYGDAGGKTGGNAIKEIIGDALRNAGMRFGAALDLWHKGDLHGEGEREDETRAVAPRYDGDPWGTPAPADPGAADAWIDQWRRDLASATKSRLSTLAVEVSRASREGQISPEQMEALRLEHAHRSAELSAAKATSESGAA